MNIDNGTWVFVWKGAVEGLNVITGFNLVLTIYYCCFNNGANTSLKTRDLSHHLSRHLLRH